MRFASQQQQPPPQTPNLYSSRHSNFNYRQQNDTTNSNINNNINNNNNNIYSNLSTATTKHRRPPPPLIDKITIRQALSDQGIPIKLDLFDKSIPDRYEVIALYEALIMLILGFNDTVLFRSDQELLNFIAAKGLGRRRTAQPTEFKAEGVKPEEIYTYIDSVDECLPDGGRLHRLGISNLRLFRYLQRIGDALGVEGITFQDISKPTGSRVQMICSAVVHYLTFQSECLTDTIVQWDSLLMAKEEIKEFKEENLRLSSQRADLDQLLERKSKETSRLQSELQNLEISLKGYIEEFNRVRMKVEGVSEIERESEASLCSLKSKEEGLRDEIEALKAQIVVSPRRLVDTLKALEVDVNIERENLRAAESLKETSKINLYIYQKLFKRITKSKALLVSLSDIINNLREVQQLICQLDGRVKANEEAMSICAANELKLRAEFDEHQIGREKFREETAAKLEELERRLTDIKIQTEVRSKHLVEEITRTKQLEEKTSSLKEDISDEITSHSNLMKKLKMQDVEFNKIIGDVCSHIYKEFSSISAESYLHIT